MSITHFISITFEVKKTEENIKMILDDLLHNGIVYFNNMRANGYDGYRVINTSQAALKLLVPDELGEGGPYLECKLESTRFFLRIYAAKNNNIDLHISTFAFPWKSELWNGISSSNFDFARYLRFFLKIFKNYQLIDIHAHTEE